MSFPANLHDSCAASNLTDYRRVREVLTGNQWILTIKLMFPVSLFQKQNQWIYLSHLSIIISLIISLSYIHLYILLTSSLVITWSMANREGRDPLVWNRHLIFQFSRNSKKHQNGVTFVRKHHFPLMNAQKGVAPMVRRYISTWYLCFEDCCATRSPCWEPGSPTIDRLAGWHGRWLGHFRYPKLRKCGTCRIVSMWTVQRVLHRRLMHRLEMSLAAILWTCSWVLACPRLRSRELTPGAPVLAKSWCSSMAKSWWIGCVTAMNYRRW